MQTYRTVLSRSILAVLLALPIAQPALADDNQLDTALAAVLDQYQFTGKVESTLEDRLGREFDENLAKLGRVLFFDEIVSLHDDNACAGCHGPQAGFGDTQSISYGVVNNAIVGPNRNGTRNERRAPILTNVGFFPTLMLNGRFEATSGDPFDNSQGFTFPAPNDVRFDTPDPLVPNLLTAQAFMPVRTLQEMSGFQGTAGTIDPVFDQFDDGIGAPIPPEPGRDDGIWDIVVERLMDNAQYRQIFQRNFGHGPIRFEWVGQALAEFQIGLLAADAPIDRFARGDTEAMSSGQKRGALLFFGEARCVHCHAVSGAAPEMFSDFVNHVIAVPPVHPLFGVDLANNLLDGPGENEDFGRFRITGDPADKYAFRTPPLRNIGLQPAFFHNGSFLTLEGAIRHHLDVAASLIDYDPAVEGIEEDLHHLGPIQPLLAAIDPILQSPIILDPDEFDDLVEFVRDGLFDEKASPRELCRLIPPRVPSNRPLPAFEGCPGDD